MSRVIGFPGSSSMETSCLELRFNVSLMDDLSRKSVIDSRVGLSKDTVNAGMDRTTRHLFKTEIIDKQKTENFPKFDELKKLKHQMHTCSAKLKCTSPKSLVTLMKQFEGMPTVKYPKILRLEYAKTKSAPPNASNGLLRNTNPPPFLITRKYPKRRKEIYCKQLTAVRKMARGPFFLYDAKNLPKKRERQLNNIPNTLDVVLTVLLTIEKIQHEKRARENNLSMTDVTMKVELEKRMLSTAYLFLKVAIFTFPLDLETKMYTIVPKSTTERETIFLIRDNTRNFMRKYKRKISTNPGPPAKRVRNDRYPMSLDGLPRFNRIDNLNKLYLHQLGYMIY